jgi:hypothetical protein
MTANPTGLRNLLTGDTCKRMVTWSRPESRNHPLPRGKPNRHLQCIGGGELKMCPSP